MKVDRYILIKNRSKIWSLVNNLWQNEHSCFRFFILKRISIKLWNKCHRNQNHARNLYIYGSLEKFKQFRKSLQIGSHEWIGRHLAKSEHLSTWSSFCGDQPSFFLHWGGELILQEVGCQISVEHFQFCLSEERCVLT